VLEQIISTATATSGLDPQLGVQHSCKGSRVSMNLLLRFEATWISSLVMPFQELSLLPSGSLLFFLN